jgi:hypothetical protein
MFIFNPTLTYNFQSAETMKIVTKMISNISHLVYTTTQISLFDRNHNGTCNAQLITFIIIDYIAIMTISCRDNNLNRVFI